MYFSKFKILFILLFFFILSCTGDSLIPVRGPEGNPDEELNFAQFDDIPIPINSRLIKEQSIVISKKKGWLGRLVFDTSEKQLVVFDFFRNELPKFGWKKLSEVSSETSFLNYQNADRIASIQIFANTLFGSEVSITVSEIENN